MISTDDHDGPTSIPPIPHDGVRAVKDLFHSGWRQAVGVQFLFVFRIKH
jgi:hypothetical protein